MKSRSRASSSKYRLREVESDKIKRRLRSKSRRPLITSRVRSKMTTSPRPLIANAAKAIHQAHFLRLSKPTPPRLVIIPRANSNTPGNFPSFLNANQAGLFKSHVRFQSGFGKSSDAAITRATAAARNRNTDTTTTVLGLLAIDISSGSTVADECMIAEYQIELPSQPPNGSERASPRSCPWSTGIRRQSCCRKMDPTRCAPYAESRRQVFS